MEEGPVKVEAEAYEIAGQFKSEGGQRETNKQKRESSLAQKGLRTLVGSVPTFPKRYKTTSYMGVVADHAQFPSLWFLQGQWLLSP